jgi:hypothetical protein
MVHLHQLQQPKPKETAVMVDTEVAAAVEPEDIQQRMELIVTMIMFLDLQELAVLELKAAKAETD